MEVLNRVATPINGKEFVLKEYFNKNDFVDKGDNGVFIRHEPLLRVAKKVLGIEQRASQVVQTGSKANEWSYTVTVTYKFKEGLQWGSTAEARLSNVDKSMDQYTCTLAETRASSRALRFALGVDVCSAEELGKVKNIDNSTLDDSPVEESQIRVIKRSIDKCGISVDKALDMAKTDTLEELTSGEAAKLIKELMKLQNKKKG